MTSWNDLDAFLASRGVRFGAPTIGQTTGGGHVADSYHYRGLARDYGNANSDVGAIIAAFRPYAVPGGPIVELFGPGVSIKNGVPIPTVPGHTDHVHVAICAGCTLAPSGDIGAGAGIGGSAEVPAPQSAIGRVLAPLQALTSLADVATNAATWRRFGLILAGAAAVTTGVVILKRDLIESTAKLAALA